MSVEAAGACLRPEDRQAEDQEHQEDHDEDVKQKTGNIRRSGG
jgi:hypothetical protein